tara:strand:- start:368 stop:709 length:342 start_codon:yes stop_codon:yes gene_type:complete
MNVRIKILKLNEAKEREVQDEYKGYIVLNIRQSQDIDRTEILGFIRAIPNVTTIRREREISTTENTYTGEFLVRIVLKHGESIKKYVDSVLKPKIRLINGVSLQGLKDLEKVS